MTAIGDLMDPKLLEQEIEQGFIRVVQHPVEEGLKLYNYTERAQYEKRWNDATEQCRGLIVDADGAVVARPFRKFWNWAEQPGLISDWEHVSVVDKMDGSLGIGYYYVADNDDELYLAIATRGSFTSDQAKWATSWLRNTYPEWLPTARITPLFEILIDWNRIVVDYGDRFRDLEAVPQRSARNDRGEHVREAEDGLGAVPCLSCGGSTSGSGEERGSSPRQREAVAGGEPGTLSGTRKAACGPDSGSALGAEEGSVYGLRGDVSSSLDGLGSRSRGEEAHALSGAQHEDGARGDREVSACVCELPPRSDVPSGRGLLVLLGGVNMDSGAVLGPHEARVTLSWPGEIAEILPYTNFGKFRDSEAAQRPNREGVVVRCGDKMIKWKQEDYVILHRLVTGLTNRRIWEALKEGLEIHELGLPDEFYKWAKVEADILTACFDSWKAEAVEEFESLNAGFHGMVPSRKEFAEMASTSSYRAACFKLLDGQSIDDMAWAAVKPETITKPYGGMNG